MRNLTPAQILELAKSGKLTQEAISQDQGKRAWSEILTQSEEILALKKFARKISKRNLESKVTVLLSGETGTGKELFAEVLHGSRDGNFIAINCGAMPEHLIESQLFGHQRGSFTGAMKDKKGMIHEAQDGTLFLDEVGELPIHTQSKLLRFVQTRKFAPIGCDEPEKFKSNAQLVFATNRELRNSKDFRQDLYYRIAMIEIRLPTLKERGKEEVLFLIKKLAEKHGLTNEALQAYLESKGENLDYPGNLRELTNDILVASILV